MSLTVLFTLLFLGAAHGVDVSGSQQNLSAAQLVMNPQLILIYKVDGSDFQNYIDPRLKAKNLFGDSTYIVQYLSNETVTLTSVSSTNTISPAPEPLSDVYAIVKYENTFGRETLLSLIPDPAFKAGNVGMMEPYGIHTTTKAEYKLSNKTREVSFFLKTLKSSIRVKATFKPDKIVDYKNDSTLAGFLIGNKTNSNHFQSFYSKKNPNASVPLVTGKSYNYMYTAVYECEIISLKSNVLTKYIGQIHGLNQNEPSWCLYAPYGAQIFTANTPVTS